jgi:hypothetical protein
MKKNLYVMKNYYLSRHRYSKLLRLQIQYITEYDTLQSTLMSCRIKKYLTKNLILKNTVNLKGLCYI